MRLMTISTSILIYMILSMGNRTGVAQQSTAAPPMKVPLCEVLTHPKKYSGSNLVVTARFTATKEGTDLWDRDCPGLGVDLLENPVADSHPDMVELYRMLKDHGMSDHPVMATVTGQFKTDQYDAARDRRRWVFIAAAASDISQTKRVEHRRFR
jgi:hypothetical protein